MSDVRDKSETIDVAVVKDEPRRPMMMLARAMAPLFRTSRREPANLLPAKIDFSSNHQFGPRRQTRLILISLVLVVALPVLISGTYLFAFASDQYASEARFAVRTLGFESDGGKEDSASSSGLLSASSSIGTQDTSITADYIRSRSIIDDISKTLDIRAIFQRPEADVYARLPKNASAEQVTDYWKKMVSVYVENSSGIVTVEVRAFRRDDALVLVNAIVEASKTLVANLSNAMRADAMKHAETEMLRSAKLVHSALLDMTDFRNSHGMIDPVKTADETGKLLLQLMIEKIHLEAQLFVIKRNNPNVPSAMSIRDRLDIVDSQIKSLQQQIAGDETMTSNLAASISRFEQLDLNRKFAERMYVFAQDGVDRARLLAERQSAYIEVFVRPSLSQDYSYPLRFTDFMLILVGVLIAWSCGATIWASVLDHQM